MNDDLLKIILKGIIFHRITDNDDQQEGFDIDKDKGYSYSIPYSKADKYAKGRIVLVERIHNSSDSKNQLFLFIIKNKQKADSSHRKIILSKENFEIDFDLQNFEETLDPNKQRNFKEKYKEENATFSKNISLKIFESIAEKNPDANDFILNILFKPINIELEQEAKKNLFSFAGFHQDTHSEEIIFEDNAIPHEIKMMLPEHNIDQFGCYSYKSYDEELFIIMANRNKIEDYFGVDLVFMNDIDQNLIMIQYKMLKYSSNSWGCRDRRLEEQVRKMQDTIRYISENIQSPELESEDIYRMNQNPFFIRFLKNKETQEGFNSYIIPLQLYEILKKQGKFNGERGGLCITDTVLKGKSIGISDLSNLIKNGYIGTYPSAYKVIAQLVSLLSKRNSEHPLILGYKKALNKNNDENPQSSL
ncbi:hypothetical protein [Avibacterium sp. 21-599]|uniref:hypothetical protein n=1 Tax=Avibacterium sp. 21-599 TaxID=2911528 RepID=UPI002245C6F6|nr:hypothetical protein [Avibacterium sp. 21-599]MCW9716991.1 hypothetical protein [Avibacterium sp. 21-599]